MYRAQGPRSQLDELIAESRRLQDFLIRVVVKLDVFAEQLTEEAARLQQVTGAEDERTSADDHQALPPGSGSAHGEGSRADEGGGS